MNESDVISKIIYWLSFFGFMVTSGAVMFGYYQPNQQTMNSLMLLMMADVTLIQMMIRNKK